MVRKMTFVFLLLQIVFASAFAQTVLTYSTHAMGVNDVLTLKKVEGVKPGEAGANQIWDYSGANVIGDHVIYYNSNDNGKSFACEQDAEMTVYFDVNSTQKLYNGLTTERAKIEFKTPIREMIYPFAYNSQVSGKMDGTYTVLGTGEVETIDGVYSVTGDAYGTLILPNGVTFKDVLRVKYVKDYNQMFCGNLYHITVNRYLFYAPESRYAIMQIHEDIRNCSCACSSTTYSACFNDNIVPGSNKPEEKPNLNPMSNFVYTAYPNPFENEFTVGYTMVATAKVKISILDLAGKELKVLVNARQAEGTYTASADLGYLPNSSYVLKIQVGNKSYTEKIVKK